MPSTAHPYSTSNLRSGFNKIGALAPSEITDKASDYTFWPEHGVCFRLQYFRGTLTGFVSEHHPGHLQQNNKPAVIAIYKLLRIFIVHYKQS